MSAMRECGQCGAGPGVVSFRVIEEGGGWKDLECTVCGYRFTEEADYTANAIEVAEHEEQLVWGDGPEPEDADAAAAFIEATANGGY